MIRTVKTTATAFTGAVKHDVYDGEKLLGYVYKDDRTTPIMAKDGNYSVGQRVEHGWRFELLNVNPRLRSLDALDRDRFRRLSHGFSRTRKDAVAEIVDISGKLDAQVAWAERSRA